MDKLFAVIENPKTSGTAVGKNDSFVLILETLEELHRKITPGKP